MSKNDFTTGNILEELIKFAFPVLAALFLQAMYGAVDLLVVGQFSDSVNVSAVSTGSQIMLTITNLVASFAMGTTILLGQLIGQGKRKDAGKVMGTSIMMFLGIGIVMTVIMPLFSPAIATAMNAPEEAYDLTVSYIRVCGGGIIVVIAYNLIGAVFRGIGDSKSPLLTVVIACVFNIIGDLVFVAVFNLGTLGAAVATVLAQAISVVISIVIIRKKELPIDFSSSDLKFVSKNATRITVLGAPIALQDLLVGLSFLIIMAIVNVYGVVSSAGVGVAEKVCCFIMLVPSAFMQSMSAFVAQNYGAGKIDRARKSFRYAIMLSTALGVVMFFITFWHGDLLAVVFSKDELVVEAAFDYLKAYGVDCLFTCFLFCSVGFFNGVGKTTFVMVEGIIGALCIRVPVSYLMSVLFPGNLFYIGLAIPCSTIVQIILCLIAYILWVKKMQKMQLTDCLYNGDLE